MRKLELEIDDTVSELLHVLGYTGALDGHRRTVEQVVLQLIDHAQQGVYRPGSWERGWLEQAFGDAWQQDLEPGDPYGRSDCALIFQRPRRRR